VCEFNQLLASEEMILPVVMDQVPDIMVHILRGKDKDIQQVAFARFKAKDVMAGNFMEPAKWIYFQEDKVWTGNDTAQAMCMRFIANYFIL
jgi:hypothetical protein